MPILTIFESMRPRQWTKNLVVFAALIFARHLVDQNLVLRTLVGFVSFCLFSSCVYILNDLKDRERDAAHPNKAHRPIASGRLRPPMAWAALGVLLTVSLGLGWRLGPDFLLVGVLYLILNVFYSFLLRNIMILDVMAISAGFVLRAIGGAEIIRDAGQPVEISAWLLICTFFLSLFLSLGKRRHEIALVGGVHRASLRGYSVDILDRLINISASVTLLSYAIYTIWPETVQNFGTTNLVYTVPFVFYGLAHYLHLVVDEDRGGDPSEMLLTQKSIMLTVLLWILCVGWILYIR